MFCVLACPGIMVTSDLMAGPPCALGYVRIEVMGIGMFFGSCHWMVVVALLEVGLSWWLHDRANSVVSMWARGYPPKWLSRSAVPPRLVDTWRLYTYLLPLDWWFRILRLGQARAPQWIGSQNERCRSNATHCTIQKMGQRKKKKKKVLMLIINFEKYSFSKLIIMLINIMFYFAEMR